MRAAMGSPAPAAPTPQETPPQHSQPSAGSKVADKSTMADLLHQQTEVHLVPSCHLMDSRQAVNASNVLMKSATVRLNVDAENRVIARCLNRPSGLLAEEEVPCSRCQATGQLQGGAPARCHRQPGSRCARAQEGAAKAKPAWRRPQGR